MKNKRNTANYQKMKTAIYLLIVILSPIWGMAQTITGNLSLLPNQSIKLEGFNGLKTYPISTTTIDEKGNFNLNYSKADYGVPPTLFSNNYISLNLILSRL
jgi:hypothetical protein